MNQYDQDFKCSSTRSSQKELSENWFRTPKATQRTITLQYDNKIQSKKLIENNKSITQPCKSFRESFQKILSKIGSFVTSTSDFQSPMQQIYDHQSEIINLKQQIQIQTDQIKQKDMMIKKINFTVQQITSDNQ
ncbi:unnamed protein product [Paramecium sonneborni]|uniref:Uncharacterized protein n=1 Tax=Paramecium sonneborni TaxID=65129 RepID=A0A8S1KNZ4_9CILI|nr:unnamed protein product [Paramecium sonneborni]